MAWEVGATKPEIASWPPDSLLPCAVYLEALDLGDPGDNGGAIPGLKLVKPGTIHHSGDHLQARQVGAWGWGAWGMGGMGGTSRTSKACLLSSGISPSSSSTGYFGASTPWKPCT